MAPFAICYPEDGGYLHVGSIGEGQQGSAGEYTLSFEGAEGESLCPEVANYREHEGVNKLYSYQHYQNDSTIHATMIHRFCDGGDLYALYMSYADQNLVVPERLIWRFLDQMLGALDFLHRQCSLPVSHRDLFFGNILVKWPANPKNRPDFLISDLGYSMTHDVEGAKACSLDPLSRMLLRSDAETFATDYRDISATAFFLMHGDKEDQRCKEYKNEIWVEEHYSKELVALVNSLNDYSEQLAKDIDADDSAIRNLVATRAKRSRKNDPPLDLDRVRPPPRDPTPLLFDSYEELTAHTPKPPGPWVAVAVTPKSFIITWTDDEPQCSEHVHFTESACNRVKLNRNPGCMTESMSMTEPFPISESDAMTHSEAIFRDIMRI